MFQPSTLLKPGLKRTPDTSLRVGRGASPDCDLRGLAGYPVHYDIEVYEP